MKRWLRLIAICGLMLIGAGAVGTALAQPREDHVAYAEESEVVFQQKSYTYEAEGEKFTLVLLSETECSLSDGVEAKQGTYTRIGNNLALHFEEIDLEVSVNDITGTFGEVVDEEKEGWAKQAFDTYIVPIFAGISITSIASLAFVVIFTIIKDKIRNKAQEADKKEQDKKFAQCTDILEQVKSILTKINAIYELVIKSDKLNNETKDFVVKSLGDVLGKVNKIDNLCEVNSLLVQLECKVAKCSDGAIKNGIVEDIDKITRLVKQL